MPFAKDAHAFARYLADEALTEWVYEDLCGACAIASAYLLMRLRERNVDARVQVGAQHAFVRVGDYYVDVTAEQFGHEPIYIDTKPPDDNPTYCEEFTANTVEDLITWMRANGWPWDAGIIEQFVLCRREEAA